MTYEKLAGLFEGPLRAWQYTIVFVDDGSTMDRRTSCARIRARDDRVRVITFPRNFARWPRWLAGFKKRLWATSC